MIHQLIFAEPKPGLSPQAFQDYWVNVHAVRYAAKIPQITQYLVATRVEAPSPRGLPLYQGVAEIWLADEQAQLASLQSPEFLDGARRDEPRWAAFWLTLVLDTEPTVLQEGPPVPGRAKVYVLLKRQPAMPRRDFQQFLLARHAPHALSLPEVCGYEIAFSRSSQYDLGEPRFDAVEIWAFPDLGAAQRALAPEVLQPIEESWRTLADPQCLFSLVGEEHWVIRPGER